MIINNQEVNGKYFIYDGCHKIYILESGDDFVEATHEGYSIENVHPIESIASVFNRSCELRFIRNWKLDRSYVKQFEKATFRGKTL